MIFWVISSLIAVVLSYLLSSTLSTNSPQPHYAPNHDQNLTRIIAIGDLHGDFDAFLEILQFSNASSADYVIQIGDTIDRGDDTIPILEYFLHNSTDFFYQIIGNHEAMNMNGRLEYVSKGDIDSFIDIKNRTQYFSEDGRYGKYLTTLNLTAGIGDVIFVHGGISLEIAQEYKTIENINKIGKQTDMNTLSGIWGRNGPLWYRGYSMKNSNGNCKELRESLDILGYKHMIMGHTVHDKINSRCSSSAIIIDTGISKAMRGKPSALEILQHNGRTVSMTGLYKTHFEAIYNKTVN
jgi:predicted phosphodiesterase